MTLIDSTFFGNSASFGGAIGNHTTVVLTNVTIVGELGGEAAAAASPTAARRH